jgi:hypothetical protein
MNPKAKGIPGHHQVYTAIRWKPNHTLARMLQGAVQKHRLIYMYEISLFFFASFQCHWF